MATSPKKQAMEALENFDLDWLQHLHLEKNLVFPKVLVEQQEFNHTKLS